MVRMGRSLRMALQLQTQTEVMRQSSEPRAAVRVAAQLRSEGTVIRSTMLRHAKQHSQCGQLLTEQASCPSCENFKSAQPAKSPNTLADVLKRSWASQHIAGCMRALRTLAYAVFINPRVFELLSARRFAILHHKCQKRTLLG